MSLTTTRTGRRTPLIRALSIQRGRGDLLDEVMAITAMIVVPLDVPVFEPIRPAVTLLILAVVAWRWRSVQRVLLDGAYVFALPALCLASLVWADAAWPALRHGALLALTMVIAGTMAARLDRRQFVVALLLSQGMLAAWSWLDGTTVWSGGLDGSLSLIGIFPQKNVIGQRMMLLTLACVAVLLVPGYRWALRLVAGATLPLALAIIWRSGSASALILVSGAGAILLFALFVWRPASRVRGARPVIAFGTAAALALGLLVLTSVLRIDPAGDLLAALGKDSTLTGRTDVWAVAFQSVRDHPALGVGAGNFWRHDSWAAVQLVQRFPGADPTSFNFHNAYFEALVHLGAVGMATAAFVWWRGAGVVVWAWWTNQRAGDPFWVALAAALMLRSFVESELFRPTLPGAILFWFAVFAAEHGRREARRSGRREALRRRGAARRAATATPAPTATGAAPA